MERSEWAGVEKKVLPYKTSNRQTRKMRTARARTRVRVRARVRVSVRFAYS